MVLGKTGPVLKVVAFEHYFAAAGSWLRCVTYARAIRLNADDVAMLSIDDGTGWRSYHPVRRVRVQEV